MARQPATWLQFSAYRYLLRRTEDALLGESVRAGFGARPVAFGCVITAVAVAGCALLAVLRPHVAFDHAQIVVSRESGALFVRVGDVWHPVLNLASARLIAATAAVPQPVAESDLENTKRGPLLGIPGAPQFLGRSLPSGEVAWLLCASTGVGTTTVIIGRNEARPAHRVAAGEAILVAAAPGSPAYLLYDDHRALVDLDDAGVVRALRLEGRVPLLVPEALLNAVPEAPPLAAPRIRGLGGKTPELPGFVVGSVLRITRADGDEFYAVLTGGVQRIGQVAVDLLRFSNPNATANPVSVAPDVIRAAPVVTELPVTLFPGRAPALADFAGTLCVSWAETRPGHADVAFLAESGLPLPSGRAPVAMAQADGNGPALDAVYVPAGRSVYVRAGDKTGTRYLITDTGVRFAVHDDDAARDLGLSDAGLAPWPLLTLLPGGPELSRRNASVARDAVAGPP